ncbi:MAG: sugar phosphate isomerase/epimerase family protein [Anaerolineae bacterium]
MKLALSTGSLYTYGVDRVFALAKEVGFDGVEVLIDPRWDTRHSHYLNSLQARYDLPILSVHSPFTRKVDGWEEDEVERVKRSVVLAEAVGAQTLVVHLPLRFVEILMKGLFIGVGLYLPLGGQLGYRRWLLQELTEFQASTAVTVAVENMPVKRFLGLQIQGYHLNDFHYLERFPYLTLDTTHLATRGLDILDAYQRLADRVVHVHLSNYNGYEHRLLNDGHLPLAQLLHRLAEDSFAGVVTLEFNPHTMEAKDERKVRENLERALAFCQRCVAPG